MKKLVLALVAVAAISLASCHDKTANNAGNNDSDSIAQVDTANAVLTPDLKFAIEFPSMLSLYTPTHKSYSFLASFPAGVAYGWDVLKGYVSDMKYVFSASGAKSLGGFGTIGSRFPSSWDWYIFWKMTAFLSIILAFMNILLSILSQCFKENDVMPISMIRYNCTIWKCISTLRCCQSKRGNTLVCLVIFYLWLSTNITN